MKIDFIRQLLVLIFSFMLSLLSVVVAEHVHLSTPEAVDCELCTHAGSDATLYVSQDPIDPFRHLLETYS
jgi:hypothetical protein